jgi:hypothetical protein
MLWAWATFPDRTLKRLGSPFSPDRKDSVVWKLGILFGIFQSPGEKRGGFSVFAQDSLTADA